MQAWIYFNNRQINWARKEGVRLTCPQSLRSDPPGPRLFPQGHLPSTGPEDTAGGRKKNRPDKGDSLSRPLIADLCYLADCSRRT